MKPLLMMDILLIQIFEWFKVKDAKNKIINKLMDLNIGKKTVKFKLRDWEFQGSDIGGARYPLYILKMEHWFNCQRKAFL